MGIRISPHTTLQPVKISDFLILRNLMTKIYPETYDYLWPDGGEWYVDHVYNVETLATDIEEADSELSFIVQDQIVMGILKVQWKMPYPDHPERRGCRLHRLYLSSVAHGTGLASTLMEYVERRAIHEGAELLWLDCMDSEPRALRFYKKHGFEKGRKYHLDFLRMHDRYRGIFLMHKDLE